MIEPSRLWLSRNQPLVVAHRGARSLAPENTLAAFRKAADLGVDAVECDVQLSRDGVPVVFHDFTLQRCTDFAERAAAGAQQRSPFLADWTSDELRSLDAGSWFGRQDPFGQIAAGRVAAADLASFQGERIPTLHEVLDLCLQTGVGLVLEVKQMAQPSAELVERCVEALRERAMLERAVLISFDHPSLVLARKLEPALAAGALLVSRLADPGRYAREQLDAQMVSVYYPPGAFVRTDPRRTYLAEDAESAHKAGVAYHVWTANEAADLAGLVEAGVDGIGTDFPQTLLELLAARASR